MVSTLLAAVYFYIISHSIGYAEVGLNYEQAVQKLELWRIVTAQLSHVELLHLLFNLSTLWSLGVVEESGSGARSGTLYYFQTSLVLLIFSALVKAPLRYSLSSPCPLLPTHAWNSHHTKDGPLQSTVLLRQ